MIIEDGRGRGKSAGVDANQYLQTAGPSWSRQSFESQIFKRSYQVFSEHTITVAGTKNVLFLQNTNEELEMIITYLRTQSVGVTGAPAVGEFWEFGLDETFTSGGVDVVPVNVNAGSSKIADVLAKGDNPTLGGTFSVFDKYYPVAADNNVTVYNKEGSVVIPPNRTFSMRYTTTSAAGLLYARASFFFTDPSG